MTDVQQEVLERMPAVQTSMPTTQANPYLGMIQTMIERGGDLANLNQMLDLQIKWEANEARKAFVAAVAAFKADPPRVYKDRENLQYGSRYTSIGNMVNTVSAAMGPHGLSANWEVTQGDKIEVTCVLTHVMGHSERVTLKGPPDKSGAKNDLQQIKSTLTYLKLASFEAVTGIASDEGGMDDDGNGYGSHAEPEEPDYSEWFQKIAGAPNLTDLRKVKDEMLAKIGDEKNRVPKPVLNAYNARVKAVTEAMG